MITKVDISFINCIYWFATVYVLVKVLLKVWFLISNYIVPDFRKPQDFKHYGQWAVITGSTDGVGKGFAKELASRGVDICLISRNEEKLKNVAKEIEDNYGVKTKYIVADFTNPNIYGHIKKNLSDLDIGILVNNVGIIADEMEQFSEHDERMVRDYINVNIMSVTMMTYIALPCLMNKKRGLILNMSSLCSEIAFPYFAEYCASKAFITMFGSCLSYELKKYNIQVTTFIAGMIYTDFLRKLPYIIKLTRKIFPFTILNVEQFVKNALKTISSGSYKNGGHFWFDILFIFGKLVPIGVLSEIGLYAKRKDVKF